jgi:hypothetical protein
VESFCERDGKVEIFGLGFLLRVEKMGLFFVFLVYFFSSGSPKLIFIPPLWPRFFTIYRPSIFFFFLFLSIAWSLSNLVSLQSLIYRLFSTFFFFFCLFLSLIPLSSSYIYIFFYLYISLSHSCFLKRFKLLLFILLSISLFVGIPPLPFFFTFSIL